MDIKLFIVLCAAYSLAWGDVIGCDEGWDNANGKCYRFETSLRDTWLQSAERCDNYGASLLYFMSQAELTWYTNWVRQYYPTTGFWTGLNRMTSYSNPQQYTTRQWTWGRYMNPISSLIQWSHSPANDGQANCGGINLMGHMYDADCNSTQGFICNTERQGGAECPSSDWVQTPTDCYYVSDTTDVTRLITWGQAQSICTSLGSGSHLLMIDDVNDKTFVTTELPKHAATPYLHWTGLHYQNNAWQWQNGATTSTFYTWAQEPDDIGGQENCGFIRFNGNFSDRSCNMQQHYACVKPQQVTDDAFNDGCGPWLRGGQKCYQFFTNPLSTWQDAKSKCISIGGSLLNANDLDTMSWFKMQMIDPVDDHPFWTSLNDINIEGTFVWGDGSVLNPNIINWNQEPNNYDGDEDCALIMPNGEYNDGTCSTQASYICELDNAATCPPDWVSRGADTGSGYDCYKFGLYGFPYRLKTQSEAQQFCQSSAKSTGREPILLSVNSAGEKAFIKLELRQYQNNPIGFWTGLNDKEAEGVWTFSNGLPVNHTFIDWNGEPNNSTADTDCALISFGGMFYVRKCSVKTGFICERAAVIPHTTTTTRSVVTRAPPAIVTRAPPAVSTDRPGPTPNNLPHTSTLTVSQSGAPAQSPSVWLLSLAFMCLLL